MLVTERLLLRPHDGSDAPFMIELNADPEVTRFTPDGPLTTGMAMEIIQSLRKQFEERRMGRFLVLRKETGERVGFCGLKPVLHQRTADLGYRFMRRFWGQGLATEAAQACVRYGIDELSLEAVTAEVDVGNARSIRVLGKLGFALLRREGSTETWELRAPG